MRDIPLNKKQARLAWWATVLLSLVAAVIGVGLLTSDARTSWRAGQDALGIFFVAGVPIVLILGLAFIRAGQKGQSDVEKTAQQAQSVVQNESSIVDFREKPKWVLKQQQYTGKDWVFDEEKQTWRPEGEDS